MVGADRAGDERQRVLFRDEPEGGEIFPAAAELDVFRDILPDGAAAFAGGGEAVKQRHSLRELARRERLYGLAVFCILPRCARERGDGFHVHLGEGLVFAGRERFGDLRHARIAAGLQDGRCHGDGPYASFKERLDVLLIRAAGVGKAQLAAEFLRHAACHFDGEQVQRAAGHVHFRARELVCRNVHREGVGKLQAKFKAVFRGKRAEPVEHGDGILVLKILAEMMIVKGDVIISHGIECFPRERIAQDGGVALHEGVELLFRNKIRSDGLDLLRRAAVQRGDGHTRADVWGDGLDIVRVLREGGKRIFFAFLPDGGGRSVLHAFDEAVELFGLNACKVIADAHVEREAAGGAKAPFAADELQRKPGFYVFIKGLRDGQFRGPFAVVAFVLRKDAGAVDAGGKLIAVHFLHGLELKEARAGIIGGDDVFRKLCVRACSGAKGRLQRFAEQGQLLLAAHGEGLLHAKHRAMGAPFGKEPFHQLWEGDGSHTFAHDDTSLWIAGLWFSR